MDQISIAESVLKTLEQLQLYVPEAILIGGLLFLVIIDLIFYKSKIKWQGHFSLLVLLFTALSLMSEFNGAVTIYFAIKLLLLIATGICILLALAEQNIKKTSEHFTMMLAVLIGCFLLLNSQSLLTFYISMETMSISAYIFTVIKLSKCSSEAGLKYLLFGATSSAIMLFGISLIYGFSGTLILAKVDITDMIEMVGLYPAIVALGMLTIGLLFKVAAVPQYIWVPDVYQSTHTSVAGYFSIVPKITGVVAFLLLLSNFNIPMSWVSTVVAIICILTIVIGNFAALFQRDVKRMLAYSSIAHTGIFLIPVVLNTYTGWQSFIFYAVIYLFMNLAAFGLVMQLERVTNSSNIEKYKGLGKTMPFIGIQILIVMIALTGLPPTAGFTAKLLIFSALWEGYSIAGDNLMLTLLVVAIGNTVVSLFYYLKVPYYMFMKDIETSESNNIAKRLNYLTASMVLILLLLFFKPDWLMELIYSINFEA